MQAVRVTRGDSPIILGQPHGGTYVPGPILADLNPRGRALADTDWHINRLYDGLLDGASVVEARFHRYVIDANRDLGGASLYPGQNTTTLVPLTDFNGDPIWRTPPDQPTINARIAAFHAPYHAALSAEIARIKALHGHAILFDCHSIRGCIPFLFEGRLPVFSIGTNDGASCDRRLQEAVRAACARAPDHDHVVNGRFKGGWTTRHYGQPGENVHAIQLELAQGAYMHEAPPWTYDTAKAERLRAVLATILADIRDTAREIFQ